MALLNTSLGVTNEAFKVPMDTSSFSIILFLALRCKTHKHSLSALDSSLITSYTSPGEEIVLPKDVTK